jgi:hypothetical protein
LALVADEVSGSISKNNGNNKGGNNGEYADILYMDDAMYAPEN